jgi:glycosyltransferase involved in cell wall biosynthesis
MKFEQVDSILSAIVPITKMAGRFHELKQWLEKCTDLKIQVILIHDIQDDMTGPELREILEQYKTLGFLLLEGKFGSAGAARNAGLAVANGSWVVFWDSDDLPNPTVAIEIIQEATGKEDLFVAAYETFELKSQNLVLTETSNLREIALNPGIWRMIFRRRTLGNTRFENFKMGEDQLFLANLRMTSLRVSFSLMPIYKYYTGHSSQATAKKENMVDLIQVMKQMRLLIDYKHSAESDFLLTMLSRQFFSAIKHGSLRTKYCAFLEWLKILVRIPKQKLGVLLQVQVLILLKSIRRKGLRSPSVLLPLTGGLGNQLFQLAAALSLQKPKVILIPHLGRPRTTSYGAPELTSFILPDYVKLMISPPRDSAFMTKIFGYSLRSGINPKKLEKQRLYLKAMISIVNFLFSIYFKRKIKSFVNQGVGYSPINNKSNFLVGYFQTYMFGIEKSTFNELRKIRLVNEGPEFMLLQELAREEEPLFVHVRLGDYKKESNFGIPHISYYRSAIAEMNTTYRFKKIWLFSDEPKEALTLIPEEYKNLIRIIGEVDNSPAATLEIMRYGKGYVIANSTFSWWAAFLAYQDSPPVIYPKPWFQGMASPIHLTPPNWQGIPSKYSISE